MKSLPVVRRSKGSDIVELGYGLSIQFGKVCTRSFYGWVYFYHAGVHITMIGFSISVLTTSYSCPLWIQLVTDFKLIISDQTTLGCFGPFDCAMLWRESITSESSFALTRDELDVCSAGRVSTVDRVYTVADVGYAIQLRNMVFESRFAKTFSVPAPMSSWYRQNMRGVFCQ